MEILFVSVFQVCEAPSLIRSSKRECFDQLIAFTSSLPHIIKEGKKMIVRHKHGFSFLSQATSISQKCVLFQQVPKKRALVPTADFLFMEHLPLSSP